MLRLIGAEGTREYAAASALHDMIAETWPEIVSTAEDDVWLVAGAKCHGQRVRDVDILLIARFAPGRSYSCFYPFTSWDGRRHTPDHVEVRSLAAVIEVKDHSSEDVHFVGTRVEVRYAEGWKDASEQNEAQVYSVKRYLEYHGLRAPHITPLLWLRNVAATDLPRRPHTLLGTPLTWETLLNVIAQLTPPRRSEGGWLLATEDPTRPALELTRAAELFTKMVEPTRLDRLRMERIARRPAEVDRLRALVGTKLVILRGRGGTGKTMRLLQLASRLSEEEGARVLILTYNRALVADIRRLLTIVGVPDDVDGGTIRIQTVHSFFAAALRAFERLKDEALSFLDGGAITAEDVEAARSAAAEGLAWDYVFVDEGQDWPRNERDLLLRLYHPARVAVADGVDQLVRGATPTDWRGGVGREQAEMVPLQRSLRMKAGLARFVTAVAHHLGLLGSGWEPNEETPGGRVLIVDGPYLADRALHDRLRRANAEDGNEPVDMLFCVPPPLVTQAASGGEARSLPAIVFEQWGLRTWDGASERVRDGYPTDVDQHRIVQYESCRGLEGWTVVNFALDRFYQHKLAHADAASEVEEQPTVRLRSDVTVARRFAARWVLIPLTRAMDTLVIQLDWPDSPLRAALEAATAECGEYVQWLSLR
jgi:hypothetical protein